jgi:hypothetical protein
MRRRWHSILIIPVVAGLVFKIAKGRMAKSPYCDCNPIRKKPG